MRFRPNPLTMKRKDNPSLGRLKKKDVRDFLIDLFVGQPDEGFSLKNLFAILRAKNHPSKMLIIDVLDEMMDAEFVHQPSRGVYALNPASIEQAGEEPEQESIIGKRYVGRVEVERNYAFLVTADRTMRNDIFIPRTQLHGALNGQKAVAEIVDWPSRSKNPIGRIVDVLGNTGDNNAEMHAILAEFGLPYDYPEAVTRAAERIQPGITAEEIARREDFRDVLTFTIDPKDAKDFDDALSIRQLKEGEWEVGVHIADVSHYVKEGDIIDREAQSRATSVYLVDRTIPMLPEHLCNYVCSLRPDEEKLCFSAVFVLDREARIKRWHLAHTVIRSDRRFTYEEVQPVLEMENGKWKMESSQAGIPPQLMEALRVLWSLAEQLRERRFKSGAIAFERPEVRFEIDEKGTPVGTYVVESNESHWLIEEFMLLANRSVAERVATDKHKKVLPYRIHDVPDPEKMENLRQLTARWGYKLRTEGSKTDISQSLNKLLSDVKGKREESLVEIVALRCMAKARYSVHNIGHYGLMFQHYTHFTSPIRRYPDTMVHRLLTRYMDGGRSVSATKYEDLCEHSSSMEQLAAQAERASIKYKQVEFMAARLGQTFAGTISGVTEFGLYVECTDNHCEGLVPIRDLEDDHYEFDERNYCLVGRRHKRRYSLGDALTVRVARANLEKRQLDFALVEDETRDEVRTSKDEARKAKNKSERRRR